MKLKDVFLGICIAALIASEIFLFRANSQKNAALTQANASKQMAAQLQQQLDQYKNTTVTTQSSDNDRLRKENVKLSQNVAQLQNTITQLQAQNEKLTQQLTTARTAVQLQQEHLQQLQTENQQAAQADVEERNACINNLRQIDAAKQQWALENNRTAADIPTEQDLLPYLRDNLFPVCPSGGSYTINAVGILPACSVPGHLLPQ
ncbi:MAG TPA: hypothetical protein VFV23_11570 [Verrucomicrobiae bacterium]|nr:hypothetical protein [Verrucomicrobiae bacterium]